MKTTQAYRIRRREILISHICFPHSNLCHYQYHSDSLLQSIPSFVPNIKRYDLFPRQPYNSICKTSKMYFGEERSFDDVSITTRKVSNTSTQMSVLLECHSVPRHHRGDDSAGNVSDVSPRSSLRDIFDQDLYDLSCDDH